MNVPLWPLNLLLMRLNISLYTIFIVLFAFVILVSCNKEQIPSEIEGAIAFNSSVGKSRALVEEIDDMENFSVYGYYTLDGSKSETVFNGDIVTRKIVNIEGTPTTVWSYSPLRYWTKDAKYVFLGFHPSDANVIINSTDINASGELISPSFTFTLNNDFTKQDDFMFGKSYCTGAVESVAVPFNHLLCQVSIKVKNPNTSTQTIILDKANLNGMSSKGRYTGFSSENPGGWSSFSGFSSYNEEYPGGITLTGEPFLLRENGYMLIPRSYPSSSLKLSLDCRVSTDGGNTYTSVNIIKNFPETQWEPSMKYVYTAEISVDYNILFSEPTVTPWGTEQTTGSVIIK